MAAKRGGGRLPAGYQEVEWIGCSGSQYIQTNYIIGIPTSLLCKVGFMTQNAGTVDRPIVWLKNTNGPTNPQSTYKFPNVYRGKIEVAGYGINNTNAFAAQDDKKIEMEFDYRDGSQIIRRSGASDLTYSNNKPTQASTKPIRILCSDRFDVSSFPNQSNFSGRLYYFYYRQDDVDVFDMIPCYRMSDGEIGMYDLVSNTFFTNAGTGTFTKGADVN